MKYYLFACLFIAADQLTKLLVRMNFSVGDSVSVIGDFFRLTYIQNRGAAFSLFTGQKVLLVLVPLLVICIALFFLHRKKGEHFTLYLSWAMIIAGGIGNLIDRVVFGYVIDMLDFSIFPPIFNVADIGVTVGCALFALYILAGDKLKEKKNRA